MIRSLFGTRLHRAGGGGSAGAGEDEAKAEDDADHHQDVDPFHGARTLLPHNLAPPGVVSMGVAYSESSVPGFTVEPLATPSGTTT